MAVTARKKPSRSPGLDGVLDLFKPLTGHNDVAFAAMVCVFLAVLFVPLPSLLLDIGLALSFAVSFLVLMVALWVKKPSEFDSFPTLLLAVTVMRLALSVASTRLILAQGHTGTDAAGHTIEGFAYFVVGGDYLIGAIVFAILVVINFIVITKGSGRIAEVAARFTLDAMTGKQMAVDADLGAGLIDDTEARRRRKEIEGESSFFGSMDGAAKFVRGDAVAGLIITGVNILGGLLIGIIRHDMDFGAALQTYTVLTIGDGLVTQIPALVVSIAAGIIVTRGNTDGAAGHAVVGQLGNNSKALYAAAALVGCMGLVPGLPLTIFLPVAAGLAVVGMMTQRRARDAAQAAEQDAKRKASAPTDAEQPEDVMRIETILLELGSDLITMIGDPDAALPGKVRSLRNLFAQDYGFILPTVRIKDSAALSKDQYRISIQGVSAATGEIILGSRLLIDPSEEVTSFPGRRVREPTFGLSALWITEARALEAEAMGLTVVDAESVIITHLTEVIREHMPDLLTYGATQELLKTLDADYRKLITDLSVPTPVILLQQVLQSLLSERVSIRNLDLVAEAIAEAGAVTRNPQVITEHIRRKLAAQICASLEDGTGYVPVVTLGQAWESEFAATIRVQGDETSCVMSPKRVQDFVLAARIEIQKFAARDEWPAVLVNPDFRPVIRSMLERVSPMTQVISHAEIHRKARLKTVAAIGG